MDDAPVSAGRVKVHSRTVAIEGYRRDDGLWDIEAALQDVRAYDTDMITWVRPAGTPLHHMLLRLTVDAELRIVAADARTDAAPYPGVCESIAPKYRELIGLRIAAGFRRELTRIFGGVRGCTHLTELVGIMATAAVQTVGPYIEKRNAGRPAQLDGCHALATDGATVAFYYPAWTADRK
jgi:hypothetical protein